MSFRRRRYGRGRFQYGKRARNGRRGGSGWGTAGKALALATTALSVAKGVKSLINVEFKSHTDSTTYVNEPIPNTGEIRLVSAIATGDSFDDRNGWSIKAKGISWKGRVQWNEDGDKAQGVRFMCFIDYNQDGSNPPGIAVNPDGMLYSVDVHALRNLENTDRYRMLWDKLIYVTETQRVKTMNFNRKLDHKVEFVGETSAHASAGGGSIWFMWLSDDTTDTYEPFVNGTFRFRYIDN